MLASCWKYKSTKENIFEFVQPISESALDSCSSQFVNQDWHFLDGFTDSTKMAETFATTMESYIVDFFPLKRVDVSSFDQPFFTESIVFMGKVISILRSVQKERDKY